MHPSLVPGNPVLYMGINIASREQTKVDFRVPERNQEVQNSPKRVPERNQEVQNSPKWVPERNQ